MKKYLIGLYLSLLSIGLSAQNVGISFSFFFPENGEFSMPVSPFSYRGVALPFNDYIGLQTGISLYRMGGLGIKDLPFESDKSLLGPNLTVYVPGELYLQFGNSNATFTIKGGVFGFAGFFNKLNLGNFDRELRDLEGWEVLNAELNFESQPGWGYQAGVELLISVSRSVGITMEVNYLAGSSKIPIIGTYTGGSQGSIQTKTADYPDAKVNLRGLEISLGAVFNN